MKPSIHRNDAGRWVLSQGSLALADFAVWADALAELITGHPLAAGEPTC